MRNDIYSLLSHNNEFQKLIYGETYYLRESKKTFWEVLNKFHLLTPKKKSIRVCLNIANFAETENLLLKIM